MFKRKGGKLALILCAVMIMTMFGAAPAMAKTKGKLVKQYTVKPYIYDYGKKAWDDDGIKHDTYKYKYNKKGDPVKLTVKRTFSNGKTRTIDQTIMKYKYKKGAKKTRTEPFDVGETVFTYKKGVPVQSREDNDGYISLNKYKYKSRYAYYRYHMSSMHDEISESVQNFKVKTKKGYPVNITFKDGSETYKVDFYKKGKKKGLIAAVSMNRTDYKDEIKYTYKIKKGTVKKATVVQTSLDKETNKKDKTKDIYSFNYKKTKMGTKRYNSMINDIVASDIWFVHTYWY